MPLAAQDGFGDQGFGFGDEEAGGASGGSAAPAVSIGGEVSASMTGFVDEFSDGAEEVRLGDIFSGKLNFSAETSSASGFIRQFWFNTPRLAAAQTMQRSQKFGIKPDHIINFLYELALR